ncbi:MAG: hypothetical protein ACYC5N_07425, partial [Endomicrobiales bacterium]
FLLLHEALGSFIGGEGGISLEEFVRRAAAARFDALRKERNRALYGELSLQMPVGGHTAKSEGETATLEQFIPSMDPTPAEDAELIEEEQRYQAMLSRLSPEEQAVVKAVMDDDQDMEQVSREQGLDPAEARRILVKAYGLLKGGASLGENLKAVVARAREALRSAAPVDPVRAALEERSVSLGMKAAALFLRGRDVTAQYWTDADRLLGFSGIDRVEVRDADYLIHRDAWSLAQLVVTPDGKKLLYVHKLFFDALDSRGPPPGFKPGVERAAARKDFLRLLAEHETAEHAALYGRNSGYYQLFSAYLRERSPGKTAARLRTGENFHAYIEHLAQLSPGALAALGPAAQALARQKQLLEFGRFTAEFHSLLGKVSEAFLLYAFTGGLAPDASLAGQVKGWSPGAEFETLQDGAAKALEQAALAVARRRGITLEDALRHTFAAGHKAGDAAFLNRVAEAGGFAVYAGEPAEGFSPRVFVLPGKGRPVVERLLGSHIDCVRDRRAKQRVAQVVAALEPRKEVLFDALEKEFAEVIEDKGDFRICREASYVVAQLLSRSLGLPVGGSSPDRIELVSGGVRLNGYREPVLHRWVAVYENGARAALVDVTYSQFDKNFTREILAGDYSRTLRAYGYMEWGEVAAFHMEAYQRADGPVSPMLLEDLALFTKEVRRVQEGRLSEESFYNARMRARLDRVAEGFAETVGPGESAAARPGAAQRAAETARKVAQDPDGLVNPVKIGQAVAKTLVRARETKEFAWTRRYVPALAGRTFVGVYPELEGAETDKLAGLAAMGIHAVGITAGRPGKAEPVCRLPLAVQGANRPLDVRVWKQRFKKDGRPVTLLFLDHPFINDTGIADPGSRALVFGRGVLALLERFAADPVLSGAVRPPSGGSDGTLYPDMVELKGEGAAFALPALVNDGHRRSFSNTVFAFSSPDRDQGAVRVTAAQAFAFNVDIAVIEDTVKAGAMDLSHAGLLAADVTLAGPDARAAYPWLRAGVNLRAPASGAEAQTALKRELKCFDNAFKAKGAGAVMRKQANFASRTTVQQLRSFPDVDDRGRGALPDLEKHMDELKENWVSVVQLHSLFRAGNPFAFETSVVDWAGVPEVADDPALSFMAAPGDVMSGRGDAERLKAADKELSRKALARLKGEKGGRYRDFENFVRANGERFAGLDEEEQYAQFAACGQMKNILNSARAKEMRVFAEYPLRGADELESARAAALHWVRFGFDGVRLDLSALHGVPAGPLAALKEEISRSRPDATLAVALPGDAPARLRAALRDAGITIVERYLPGEKPEQAGPGDWLEIALPRDETFFAGNPAQVEQWVKALLESGALFVAIPDALRWGGSMREGPGFRNPSRGDRQFDISSALVDMVKARVSGIRKNELWGVEYEEGYGAAFNVALPDARKIDWQAFERRRALAPAEQAGREFNGPGLAGLVLARRFLRADREAGREMLLALGTGEEKVFFRAAFQALSETPGLAENEWGAGWQYLRNLEKKYGATDSAERRAGYTLQLLDFANGISDRLLERNYLLARFGSEDVPFASEGDRAMLRNLLFTASVSGVALDSGETEAVRGEVPAPVSAYLGEMAGAGALRSLSWLSLNGKSTSRRALADCRAEISTLGAGSPLLKQVAAAAYLRSYVSVWEDGKSKTELQSEARAVLEPLKDSVLAADAAPLGPADAARSRWALSELLKLFDLFAEREGRGLQVEKACNGAIDTLGIQRIRSAA